MNDKIIENEPGHDNATKSVKGLSENEGYANIVRLGNLQYAMIDMIKNPPTCFKEVVQIYFKNKGAEILEDINLWLERSKVTQVIYGVMANQNPNWCNKLNSNPKFYEDNIVKGMNELKKLLKNIK